MHKSTPTALLQQGDNVADPLTEMLRRGARQLIAQAVEAELQVFLEHHVNMKLEDGRKAVVRNGYLPTRSVQTGIGDVEIKVRDRSGQGQVFNSALLPPYLKRARSVEELLALALSQGYLHWGLPGGACRLARRSGQGAIGQYHFTPQGRLAG